MHSNSADLAEIIKTSTHRIQPVITARVQIKRWEKMILIETADQFLAETWHQRNQGQSVLIISTEIIDESRNNSPSRLLRHLLLAIQLFEHLIGLVEAAHGIG